MKNPLLLIFFSLMLSAAMAQPINTEYKAESNTPKLLGKINKEGLSQNSYAKWFQKNYSEYTPDKAIINQITDDLGSYTIELFMGTWCGDSKREVPHFYKVLEAANFPMERLTAIAVDRDAKSYKQSPGGEHEGKNIHRVPTFIFYKDGEEINRITESPVETLEADIQQILMNNYIPNYAVVTYMNDLLMELGPEKLLKKEKKWIKELDGKLENLYELNTYSNVLFYDGKMDEAIAIARLNAKIFPKEIKVYTSLANKLLKKGDTAEAIQLYEKIVSLDPEDEYNLEKLNELKSVN